MVKQERSVHDLSEVCFGSLYFGEKEYHTGDNITPPPPWDDFSSRFCPKQEGLTKRKVMATLKRFCRVIFLDRQDPSLWAVALIIEFVTHCILPVLRKISFGKNRERGCVAISHVYTVPTRYDMR